LGILIDSSILIAYERGALDVAARLKGREDEEFFVSVVSASELLHGVHRARDASVRARRSAFVEALLERFPLLGVELPTARTHARLWADLAAAGTPVGPNDLWLAATAVTHGLALVTANVREFHRVPGLQVEAWPAA
jgi:predicted nucleic acid-binding protein